jgi:hypothetical protein
MILSSKSNNRLGSSCRHMPGTGSKFSFRHRPPSISRPTEGPARTPKRKASSSDQKGALDAAKDATKGISGIHLPSRGTRRATTKGLGEAAKNIGMIAERTGKVAQQVRVASEAIGEGSAPRKSKSAIEVVLEGLTSRRQSRAG